MIEYEITGGQHESQNFAKYNGFITGKYKGSLLENKLFCLGLKNVVEENGETVAILTKKELNRLIKNKDSGSFYTQLKDTANRMMNFSIFVEDKTKRSFIAMNIVNTVAYKNGVCKIYFNHHYRQLFTNLSEKYTYLNIGSMIDMENCMSLRLYEILKSQCYVSKKEHEYLPGSVITTAGSQAEPQFRLNFGVDELRLMLGCVDISDPAIKKLFERPNISDYSAIMEEIEAIAAKEKDVRVQQRITPKWGEWKNFKRALEKAIKEINKKTELAVEMTYFGKGKSGKICNVTFDVSVYPSLKSKLNQIDLPSGTENESDDVKEPSVNELLALIDDAGKKTDHAFSLEEYKTLLEATSYSVEKIEEKYKLLKKARNVSNPMGWMIGAIQEDWKMTEASVRPSGSGMKKTKYDFDALQKMIDEG